MFAVVYGLLHVSAIQFITFNHLYSILLKHLHSLRDILYIYIVRIIIIVCLMFFFFLNENNLILIFSISC